jgi:hypothetical protein
MAATVHVQNTGLYSEYTNYKTYRLLDLWYSDLFSIFLLSRHSSLVHASVHPIQAEFESKYDWYTTQ